MSTTSSEQPSGASITKYAKYIDGAGVSQAVEGAIDRLADKDGVTAVEQACELLKHRTVYAKGKGKKKLQDLKNQLASLPTGLPLHMPVDWLSIAYRLYSPTVKHFHGKLFMLGLAISDEELKKELIKDDFLRDLIPEIKGNVRRLFSEDGKKKYDALLLEISAPDDDALENTGDNPLKEMADDTLGRAEFAKFLVKLLNNTDITNGSFSIHLYAPWGAGKTSFMNFMKKAFNDKDGEWHCADFNAWQNQSLAYPWWTFMLTVYKSIKRNLSPMFRLKELWWRWKIMRIPQVSALIVICLLSYFFATQMKGNVGWLEGVGKTLAAVAGIWAIALSVFQSFSSGSKKAAQEYLGSKDNPMMEFKTKFNSLIKALGKRKLVVFIDDLDRCKSPYVVELLENIQTIFKDANVVFIIAADKMWLNACYEVEYEKIKGFIKVEGKTIGPMFIEKMFQLSVALPGAPEEIKEKCWDKMLMHDEIADKKTPPETTTKESTTAAVPANSSADKHALNLKQLNQLADKKVMLATEHFLRPYAQFLSVNPRNMKRLLNAYLINKAIILISDKEVPKHQLILYTILTIQWPVLSEYLLDNPDALNKKNTWPADIALLMSQPEVNAVVTGKGLSDPLYRSTLEVCGILFAGSGYMYQFDEPSIKR